MTLHTPRTPRPRASTSGSGRKVSSSHRPDTRILFIAAALAVAHVSFAQSPIPNPLGDGTTLMDVITRFTDYALVLLTPLSIIMVLLTGFFYMTAGGNEEKVKRAHKTLIWTVIGIAIVLLAKSAQLIIRSALGVE